MYKAKYTTCVYPKKRILAKCVANVNTFSYVEHVLKKEDVYAFLRIWPVHV